MSPRGSGQRVSPKTGILCLSLPTSAHAPAEEQASAGQIKWTSSEHVYVEDGGSRGQVPSQQELKSLHFVFLPNQNHVCEPGMVANACNPITQETGKTLSKEKRSDSHKADPPLQISLSSPVLVPLGSAGLGHFPSSTDILAVFAYELLSGTK